MRHMLRPDFRGWVTELGARDDRFRARALAVRLGLLGLLLSTLLTVLVLIGGDEAFRRRGGGSAWWLVVMTPPTLAIAGAITGAMLRHARTVPRASAIVALAGLPGCTASAVLLRWLEGSAALPPSMWALVVLYACGATGLIWGAPVRELHRAAFDVRKAEPASSGSRRYDVG